MCGGSHWRYLVHTRFALHLCPSRGALCCCSWSRIGFLVFSSGPGEGHCFLLEFGKVGNGGDYVFRGGDGGG